MDLFYFCYTLSFIVISCCAREIYNKKRQFLQLSKNVLSLDYGYDHLLQSKLLLPNKEYLATLKVTDSRCASIEIMTERGNDSLTTFLTDSYLGTRKTFWSLVAPTKYFEILCRRTVDPMNRSGEEIMEKLKSQFDFDIRLDSERRYLYTYKQFQNQVVFLKGTYIENKFIYNAIGTTLDEFHPKIKCESLVMLLAILMIVCTLICFPEHIGCLHTCKIILF